MLLRTCLTANANAATPTMTKKKEVRDGVVEESVGEVVVSVERPADHVTRSWGRRRQYGVGRLSTAQFPVSPFDN